jgi:hypothetical protein
MTLHRQELANSANKLLLAAHTWWKEFSQEPDFHVRPSRFIAAGLTLSIGADVVSICILVDKSPDQSLQQNPKIQPH